MKWGYFEQHGLDWDPDQRVVDVIKAIAGEIVEYAGATISAAQLLEKFNFHRCAGGIWRLVVCNCLCGEPLVPMTLSQKLWTRGGRHWKNSAPVELTRAPPLSPRSRHFTPVGKLSGACECGECRMTCMLRCLAY